MPERARSVCLVGKSQSPVAIATARELAGLVLASGLPLWVEDGLAQQIGQPPVSTERLRSADLCVVVGGDGTLLRAARLLGKAEVPIFGVNAGRLGFLTEVPRDRASALLARALTGAYQAERRIKLRVRLVRPAEGGDLCLLEEEVINDAVINRGALARMVELRTLIDGTRVSEFRADGIIVATPTGSTAYNLAVNGPILMPSMEGLVVSPISPHTLTQRPLVISDRAQITIEVTQAYGEIQLSLDGQSSAPLQSGDRVEIERAATYTLLVRNPEVSFFEVLRAKLGWNEQI